MLAPLQPLESPLFQSDNFRPIPAFLKDAILEPYKAECVYIERAFRDISFDHELVAFAEVCVPETFYGSQTGHFNAVESLLCLNQIAFLTIADLVTDDAPHAFREAIGTADLQSFKENVLTRTFITSVKTQFRRTLDGRNVVMRFSFTKMRKHAGMVFMASEFEFTDAQSARNKPPAFFGQATFAIPVM
ncbi:FcoT family thioesterase [Caballeronia sp. LZ034LL]|uniref:FcoT family thioesterase n=1 Tax=Caballeronia sp. LZ034LL TaxID=3038567 RepID=UPI00285969B1|nr:FcoT family thioesterase [Caballeronia sp. LZ034LL]MDR5835827.1 FcoT family thioesterase [Caballeronia sp. LZ034LL]